MPYTPNVWTNGVSPVNATNMNHLETQYTEASSSFEQDAVTAFVLSGLVATKDGSINNQLDVTAGVAFLVQSDATLRRRAPVSSTQTTSVINTTYYLFLNNDGTWTWGTASSGPANSLWICQATTDGSGNILVVTDKRNLSPSLFPGISAALLLGGSLKGITVSGYSSFQNTLDVTGAILARAGLSQVGSQATAGSFGVPVVIASKQDQAVAVNTSVTICTATTPNDGKNHLVRFGAGVTVGAGASNNGVCNFSFTIPDPNIGALGVNVPYFNGASVVVFSAIAVGKGGAGANTLPAEWLCGPNGTVSISYQNTAAGTISDKVSGVIELLT